MNSPVRLLGICGSLRKASLNRALLREIAAMLPPNVTMEIDDKLGELPLFNSDIKDDPAIVAAFKAQISACDGVYSLHARNTTTVLPARSKTDLIGDRGHPLPRRCGANRVASSAALPA